MGRILTLAYGTVAYGAFFMVFLYMIGFAGNIDKEREMAGAIEMDREPIFTGQA